MIWLSPGHCSLSWAWPRWPTSRGAAARRRRRRHVVRAGDGGAHRARALARDDRRHRLRRDLRWLHPRPCQDRLQREQLRPLDLRRRPRVPGARAPRRRLGDAGGPRLRRHDGRFLRQHGGAGRSCRPERRRFAPDRLAAELPVGLARLPHRSHSRLARGLAVRHARSPWAHPRAAACRPHLLLVRGLCGTRPGARDLQGGA